MSKFWLYVMAVIVLGSASCKSPYKTVKIKDYKDEREAKMLEDSSANAVYLLINNQSFLPEWFSAKANVESTSDNNTLSFNIHIRNKKDSLIWISITPLLGIEAARVYITRDSLFLMDRINNQYARSDYSFLNERFNIEVNFDMLQSLLHGNFFPYKHENKFTSVYLEDPIIILSTLKKRALKRSLEEKDPNKPIVQDLFIDPINFRVLKNDIEDDKIQKKLTITYANFVHTEKGDFPLNHQTDLSAQKNFSFKINFNKIGIEGPLEFPFSIPEKYTPMH
ncbi:MAG TPA: DUF4292 domain-containing protein [Bacteroidia bacterium]|nr:DUF4292 domain-containing protein [Bacteroidia bacterium]HNT79514.1 DUF4292 domain-containing protein [Bacteroidia bacterium]